MSLERILKLAGVQSAPKAVVVEAAETPEATIEVAENGDITIVAENVTIEADVFVVEAELEDKTPELEEVKVEKETVPADIVAAINGRIAELKKAIEVQDRKGYNDGGTKDDAVEALEQILDNLKQEDGLTKAKLYYHTLASAVFHLIPPKVVKYISKPADEKQD